MKVLKSFAFLVLLITSSVCFAGRDGNGGNGVVVDGKTYSLDLFEAGNDQAPENYAVTTDPRIVKFLKSKLSPKFPIDLLAQKITEIYQMDPELAYHLLNTIWIYDWQLVGVHLQDIPFDGDTVVKLPPGQLLQLAVRFRKEIKIDRGFWGQMDSWNRVGLMLHEAFYALIRPFVFENGDTHQISLDARRVTGYVFGDMISREGLMSVISSLDTRLKTNYLDAYPTGGFSSLAKSAIHIVDTNSLVDLRIYVDHGSYGLDPDILLTEESKKQFCKTVQWDQIREFVWSLIYQTSYPDLSIFTYYERGTDPTWHDMSNGYVSWIYATRSDIDNDRTFKGCMTTLNNYELVDPLDYLSL